MTDLGAAIAWYLALFFDAVTAFFRAALLACIGLAIAWAITMVLLAICVLMDRARRRRRSR